MDELSEQIRAYFDATTAPAIAARLAVDDSNRDGAGAGTATKLTSEGSASERLDICFDPLMNNDLAEIQVPTAMKQNTRRRTLTGAAAALIVVFLVVGGLLAADRATNDGEDTPAAVLPTAAGVAEVSADAEGVARRFVVAYGSGELDVAIAQLAEGADVSGMTGGSGTRQDFAAFGSWLDAGGYQQALTGCEEHGAPAVGVRFRCYFDFQNLGSDELGLGPFPGSFFDVTVSDGYVTEATTHWDTKDFSREVWEPFTDWVTTNYSGDVATMYTDATASEAETTDRSLRLWRVRTRQWVASLLGVDPQSGDVQLGRRSMIVDGVSFTVAVPASGWEPYEGFLLSKSTHGPQGAEAVVFWAAFPDGEKADPCYGTPWPPPATIGDIAAALATASGVEVRSGPSATTIDGRNAAHVALTVFDDTGCDPGFFYNWKAQDRGAMWSAVQRGDTIDVWIVDADGTTLFIGAETHPDVYSSRVAGEIDTIVNSMQFE